ncbi:MAG: DUF6438 domain-containing protein [Archangium sp.]
MRTMLVVMVLALVSCKSTPEKAPEEDVKTAPVTEAKPDDLLLSLKRTPCFGRCPVYTVQVFADGRVRWVGDANVRERGEREARLSADEVAKIAARIDASDFATWKTDYMNHQVTDMPGAVLTWKGKTIRHYHGDESAPVDLMALETELDVLLGTAKWIRGEASDR